VNRPATPERSPLVASTPTKSTGPAATPAQGPAPPKRRGRPSSTGPKAPPKPKVTRPGAGLAGSPEAKRKASVILEVLGGLRSPTSGSAALGVSVQRYYMLEVRALQGLLSALDRKPKLGGQPSPETTLRRLIAERDRLERELLRAQALLRVAQRAVGLQPPEPPGAKTGKPGAGKRKTRTPTVRARRAAHELRTAAAASEAASATTANGATTGTTPTTTTIA